MKETILYNGLPIVGRMPTFKPALRDLNRKGLKTMTRRVINPQPPCLCAYVVNGAGDHALCYAIENGKGAGAIWVPPTPMSKDHRLPCTYGKTGDIRCMAEPLIKKEGYAHYADDGAAVVSLITGQHLKWRWSKDYLTSIHFPTEAARFVTRYTEIIAEPVKDITDADSLAEGIRTFTKDDKVLKYWPCDPCDGPWKEKWSRLPRTPRDAFKYLWDAINEKRGYGWEVNPWVWGIRYQEVA